MEWMVMPFRRYFDFAGRSRRKEYWMFYLLNILVTIPVVLVMFAGMPRGEIETSNLDFAGAGAMFWLGVGLMVVWWLAVIIPSIAVTVRRLHDRDMSGWWYGGLVIAGFIPIVNLFAALGWIALFIVLLLPGTEGSNRYGADPKDPGQASVFT